MTIHLVVPRERTGIELDEFLCLQFPLLNKGFVRTQVREGRVSVDGMPAKPSQRLKCEQVISVDLDEDEAPEPPVAPPRKIPILFESEEVIVLDKPPGLAVEPERWAREKATVSGALLSLALDRAGLPRGEATEASPGIGFRPRLVHRIDKDTSGALLVAKNLETERRLRTAFEEGGIRKVYFAIAEGEHPLADGEQDLLQSPIGPDQRRSGRMRVDESKGKPSMTQVSVEERFRGYTLLCCEPRTGRTHQIRVHLAAAGFPLGVDPLYGRRKSLSLSEIKRNYRPKPGRAELPLISRLTLHAGAIEFPDARGSMQRVESQLPKDLERVLKQLRKVRPPRR